MVEGRIAQTEPSISADAPAPGPLTIFLVFLRLGLTSFGGPIAHFGFFRDEFVGRRRWLDDRAYADLVALCQFLPGPASSQVGLAIGLTKCGYAGAAAAWLGFTLPSALIMTACGLGMIAYGDIVPPALLHGLKIAALAVVANALYGMARTLCPGRVHAGIALLAAIVMLFANAPWMQIGVIALAALAGRLLLTSDAPPTDSDTGLRFGRYAAFVAACLFAGLLVALPLLVGMTPGSGLLATADAFYRVGALVFGGGHVVLPLLQAELVPPGWIDNSRFVAGYGVAQAVPGPMFTLTAYLGAVIAPTGGPAGGLAGAAVALIAVFLPSVLILVAVLPFWATIRRMSAARAALAGVNAAVVGLLLAALYDPVWTSSIGNAQDLALALAALAALTVLRLSPWIVVVASAGAAFAFGLA
jgi:chromate transporter